MLEETHIDAEESRSAKRMTREIWISGKGVPDDELGQSVENEVRQSQG